VLVIIFVQKSKKPEAKVKLQYC